MANRPSDLVLVSRKIDSDPLEYLQTHPLWNTKGAVAMHFINAFQSLFPEGERLFIDAVRDCTQKNPSVVTDDPMFQNDLNHFIEQEGRHSVVHDSWTKALAAVGYRQMGAYTIQLHRFRTWARTHLDKMTRLSITIGAEQYTASMTKLFACDQTDLVFASAPLFQRIFLYHTMEELEHKSVCYDLYRKYHGGYLRRMLGMGFISYYIWMNVLRRHRYLLRHDGKWDRRHRHEFWMFYFGSNGILRALMPRLLEYARPSFHPWNSDERPLFEGTFGALRKELGILGFQYQQASRERTTEPPSIAPVPIVPH
jgi:predicted metal-dependent hydrolase